MRKVLMININVENHIVKISPLQMVKRMERKGMVKVRN